MMIELPPVETLPKSLEEVEKRLSTDAVVIGKALDMLGAFAVNLSIAIIIFVVTLIAAKWASSAARKILSKTRAVKRDPTVLSFLVQIVRVVVIIVGMIAVLQRLGVQTTSIIAVLGAASLAVGLALQGTLSNVAAGVMLLLLRPYRVGDVVEIGNVTGIVQKLDLFTTQLSAAGSNRVFVPNSKVLGDMIVNLSGQTNRRVEIKFTVGYGDDLNKVRQVLSDVGRNHYQVLKEPGVWTGVTGLLDSAVEVTLHAWVRSDDHFQAKADLIQSGKEALDKAGIEIPFPHQVSINHGELAMMPAQTETDIPQKD